MDEVMTLAEDLAIKIFYTDTDSMHIQERGVEPLSRAFKDKYGRELVGKGLGQFHSDFDFNKSYHVVSTPGGKSLELVADSVKLLENATVVATESFFLGKKSYIDKIEAWSTSPTINVAYHFRSKGIPTKCTQHVADRDYQSNPMELYRDLFYGKKGVDEDKRSKGIDFDLAAGGNCLFRVGKDHRISTGKMIRRIQFTAESDEEEE
jgi:hypothetical protein